jgi:hypothetical protein
MNRGLIHLLSLVTMAFSVRLSVQKTDAGASDRTTDTGMEIKLSLIQGIDGWSIKSLALGVSVINHTDSDIYIPGLRYMLYSIDHTWKNTGQYKIEFDAMSVDTAYSPAEILGYRRFPANRIKSNVLYFSNINFSDALSLAASKGDTAGYIEANFISRKGKYVNQPLRVLLNELGIPIKSYMYNISFFTDQRF